MTNQNPNFEPYEGEKPYIFVSYAHADTEILDDVKLLNKQGFRIWYDKGIRENTDWKESIEEHILKCKIFIIFVSASALKSWWVMSELQVALNEH